MSTENSLEVTRRSLLRQSLLCGSAWIWGFNQFRLPEFLVHRSSDKRGGGALLGLVPFADEGRPDGRAHRGRVGWTTVHGPLDLDTRKSRDHNRQLFYQNVFVPTIGHIDPWTIRVMGLVEKPTTISAEVLTKRIVPWAFT